MITDAAKRVAHIADQVVDLPLGRPSFRPEDHYKARDFDAKNFRRIPSPHDRDTIIAFLDGGNMALIQAPSFAVHFERIYVSCFQDNKRIRLGIPNRLEFFVITTAAGVDGEGNGNQIEYKNTFIPLHKEHAQYLPNEEDLVFDSYDKTIREGLEQIRIPRVGDVARSFAEWNYASFVCRALPDGSIFIRDGTLHAPYTNQIGYAEAAYDAAHRQNVLFCGISKTSHLYTTSGLPLTVAINRLARENGVHAPWYYENIVDITDTAHRADLNFACFHPQSRYTLRVEVLQGQEDQKERIMSAIAANSRDITFPGYPYGLIDADKNARIRREGLDSLRMLLFSEISRTGDFQDFTDLLAASDAHDWLDRMV